MRWGMIYGCARCDVLLFVPLNTVENIFLSVVTGMVVLQEWRQVENWLGLFCSALSVLGGIVLLVQGPEDTLLDGSQGLATSVNGVPAGSSTRSISDADADEVEMPNPLADPLADPEDSDDANATALSGLQVVSEESKVLDRRSFFATALARLNYRHFRSVTRSASHRSRLHAALLALRALRAPPELGGLSPGAERGAPPRCLQDFLALTARSHGPLRMQPRMAMPAAVRLPPVAAAAIAARRPL